MALAEKYVEKYKGRLIFNSSNTLLIEAISVGCGKGEAVAVLAEKYGIKREEVICIGDALNDASMVEWAGKGININAIAPGYMETDLNAAPIANNDRFTAISARIPKGRWGKAEDMKGLTVFLASPASDYICGAIIPVDGGSMVK